MLQVRCEGSHPVCKTCNAYGLQCRWEKPPPLSQVLAMAKRLQEAEKTIAELRKSDGNRESPVSSRNNSSQVPPEDITDPVPSRAALATPSETSWLGDSQALDNIEGRAVTLPPDLSLDQDGNICFYGPTSAVHDPPDLDSPASQATAYSSMVSRREAKAYLAARMNESREWESFSLKQASLRSDIPYLVIEKLLKIHWTWIAPMFMWVYRPAFIREFPSQYMGTHLSKCFTIKCD